MNPYEVGDEARKLCKAIGTAPCTGEDDCPQCGRIEKGLVTAYRAGVKRGIAATVRAAQHARDQLIPASLRSEALEVLDLDGDPLLK